MKKRILIVDDDRDMVSTLADILELHGWEAIKGYDGREAIQLAAEHDVDVILMDVRMPNVDGLTALREIKSSRPSCRIILMTAYAAQDLLRAAESEGALRILRKPLDLYELLSVLEEAQRQAHSVLVVDDDPEYLASLSGLLREHGVPTVEANSLAAALARLQESEPAAILLDLKLNHIDPRKTILAIREASPSVMLILYSGYVSELKETIMNAPPGIIDAAFIKPVPVERLLQILNPKSAQDDE